MCDTTEDLEDYKSKCEKLQEENERLKNHIIEIKEVISTWNIEYEKGYNDFEIPKKIIDVVWRR